MWKEGGGLGTQPELSGTRGRARLVVFEKNHGAKGRNSKRKGMTSASERGRTNGRKYMKHDRTGRNNDRDWKEAEWERTVCGCGQAILGVLPQGKQDDLWQQSDRHATPGAERHFKLPDLLGAFEEPSREVRQPFWKVKSFIRKLSFSSKLALCRNPGALRVDRGISSPVRVANWVWATQCSHTQ